MRSLTNAMALEWRASARRYKKWPIHTKLATSEHNATTAMTTPRTPSICIAIPNELKSRAVNAPAYRIDAARLASAAYEAKDHSKVWVWHRCWKNDIYSSSLAILQHGLKCKTRGCTGFDVDSDAQQGMSRFCYLVKQQKKTNCKRRTFRTRCLIAREPHNSKPIGWARVVRSQGQTVQAVG